MRRVRRDVGMAVMVGCGLWVAGCGRCGDHGGWMVLIWTLCCWDDGVDAMLAMGWVLDWAGHGYGGDGWIGDRDGCGAGLLM